MAKLAHLTLEHSPSVLVGDFNMTARSAVYAGARRGWTLPRPSSATSELRTPVAGRLFA